MLALFIPSTSTNIATVPWLLVMVQGGPGETQPGGVGPDVSHRFAAPTGDVIPGLKRLLLNDVDPVWLSVMSVSCTIHGEVQGTLGFHEPEPVENWGTLEPLAG